MKHIILFGFLFVVACGAHSKPFYSYDLHGNVTGDIGAVSGLADINEGDSFVIRLNVWEKEAGAHRVSFQGDIGGWSLLEQETKAYYYWGDWSPERFYTTGSSSLLNPPDGNGSTVHPYNIYLTLLGMEQTGTVTIPEKNWLIRDTGEINLKQFRSGGFHFWFFNQELESTNTEEDLVGSITRIVEVSEPSTLLLLALGSLWPLFRTISLRRRLRTC